MLRRLTLLFIILPAAIMLVALAVANRGTVDFTLDPFHPCNPALTFSLPLFVWLFAAMAIGVALGGAATWLKQGRYRKQARENAKVFASPPPVHPALPAPGV